MSSKNTTTPAKSTRSNTAPRSSSRQNKGISHAQRTGLNPPPPVGKSSTRRKLAKKGNKPKPVLRERRLSTVEETGDDSSSGVSEKSSEESEEESSEESSEEEEPSPKKTKKKTKNKTKNKTKKKQKKTKKRNPLHQPLLHIVWTPTDQAREENVFNFPRASILDIVQLQLCATSTWMRFKVGTHA